MGCPGVISRESHTGAIASEIVGEMGHLVMAAGMTPWIKMISSSRWTKIGSVLGHQCIRMALSQPGDCLLYHCSGIAGSVMAIVSSKTMLLLPSESSIFWFLVVVLSHNVWNQTKINAFDGTWKMEDSVTGRLKRRKSEKTQRNMNKWATVWLTVQWMKKVWMSHPQRGKNESECLLWGRYDPHLMNPSLNEHTIEDKHDVCPTSKFSNTPFDLWSEITLIYGVTHTIPMFE